jgi:hypothetical protein
VYVGEYHNDECEVLQAASSNKKASLVSERSEVRGRIGWIRKSGRL